MMPVKWYVWLMLGAGLVTFLYGIGTADAKVIMGSFLFFGIGGLAHFLYRPRT